MKQTERIVNGALARVLQPMHPRWSCEPETTGALRQRNLQPDILIREEGWRTCGVETELHSRTSRAPSLEEDGIRKLGQRLDGSAETLDTIVMVKIPPEIRKLPNEDLPSALKRSELGIAVLSKQDGGKQRRWPEKVGSWADASVETLAYAIEVQRVDEAIIEEGTTRLENGIRQASLFGLEKTLPEEYFGKDARPSQASAEVIAAAVDAADRAKDAAGAIARSEGVAPWGPVEIAKLLRHQTPPNWATARQNYAIAAAILINALVFHESIAGTAYGIPGLRTPALSSRGKVDRDKLTAEWRRIVREVNYWPIFDIGRRILGTLEHRSTSRRVLDECLATAEGLEALGVLKLQEVMGVMFQRLITDRHVLKTHYTLPASAHLVAGLAGARITGRSPAEVAATKVTDPACGTGSLLAAMQGFLYRRIRGMGGDDRKYHPQIMATLKGMDVMPAAAHLTATQLSSAHPETTYKRSEIFCLGYGVDKEGGMPEPQLGALEFLLERRQEALFGGGGQDLAMRTSEKNPPPPVAEISENSQDVVIMNPPFTSNTVHEGESSDIPLPTWAAFGTEAEEQEAMRGKAKSHEKRLRALRRASKTPIAGNHWAGLGSWFVDLAHEKLAPGGTLATILLATATSGNGWAGLRSLLSKEYKDILIVTIAATGATNLAFSADTDKAECIIVATKRRGEERNQPKTEEALWIALEKRPATMLEAEALVARIETVRKSKVRSTRLEWGRGNTAGSCMRNGFAQGTNGAGVQEDALMAITSRLMEGELRLPWTATKLAIPMTVARELGQVGPVDRKLGIKDTGKPRHKRSAGPLKFVRLNDDRAGVYPALWNHDSELGRKLVMSPDREGRVLARAECDDALQRRAKTQGGIDDIATELWEEWSGHLHLRRDLRLTSESLGACVTRERCLGGRAWPIWLAPNAEALAAWENTTLALVMRWAQSSRTDPGRAVMTVTQLAGKRTLDIRALEEGQIAKLEQAFASMEGKELGRINEADKDRQRERLDRMVLCDTLGMSGALYENWRRALAIWVKEPSVRGSR